jgi:hypothetical protein
MMTAQSGGLALNSNGVYIFYEDSSLAVRLRGTTSGEYNAFYTPPSTGAWVMLAVAVDMAANNGGAGTQNGDAWVYFNDTLQTIASINEDGKVGTANLAAGELLISAAGAGNFDDVQVFDRILDAGEIGAIFAAGRN